MHTYITLYMQLRFPDMLSGQQNKQKQKLRLFTSHISFNLEKGFKLSYENFSYKHRKF